MINKPYIKIPYPPDGAKAFEHQVGVVMYRGTTSYLPPVYCTTLRPCDYEDEADGNCDCGMYTLLWQGPVPSEDIGGLGDDLTKDTRLPGAETSESPPNPDCTLGYPENQVKEIMGARLREFRIWMRGQTQGVCDGQLYDIGCGPHGTVTYPTDVERFLQGLPVID